MSRLTRTLRLLPILALPALAGCVAYPYETEAGAPGTYIQPAAPQVYIAPPPVVVGGWWGPRPYYGRPYYGRPYYGHRHGRW